MNRWTETTPDKRWDRTDGARVEETAPYQFHAWGPDNAQLKTKDDSARCWNIHHSARDAVDKAFPLGRFWKGEGVKDQQRAEHRRSRFEADLAVFKTLKAGSAVRVQFVSSSWAPYDNDPDKAPQKEIVYVLEHDPVRKPSSDVYGRPSFELKVDVVPGPDAPKRAKWGQLLMRPGYCTALFHHKNAKGHSTTGAWIHLALPPSSDVVVEPEFVDDSLEAPDADDAPGCPGCDSPMYDATQFDMKTKRWRCMDPDCAIAMTEAELAEHGVQIPSPPPASNTADAEETPTEATAPTPTKTYSELVTDAAQAVQEAEKTRTGRVRSVDSYKPVAAAVLGISRLYKSRWQQVLDRGTERGLFKIDEETYSYPVIVALEPSPEPFDEVPTRSTEHSERRRDRLEPVDDLDQDFDPPRHLDCGHMNWFTAEEHATARAEDHCCMGGKKKESVSWRHLRGTHLRPVPKSSRRTTTKEATGGFHGLCCNAEGFYIGGVLNDCRRAGEQRCEVHA